MKKMFLNCTFVYVYQIAAKSVLKLQFFTATEQKTSNAINYATLQKIKPCCNKFSSRNFNIEVLVEGEKNAETF